ncbi:MAG: hypothetical protein Q4D38_14030 [Planctomycetia bacterium]|nr:hypothetical protein [Planctomycetia bacterium]
MALATAFESLPTWLYWVIAFVFFALFVVVATTWKFWKTHPEIRAFWLFFFPTLLFLCPLCPLVCGLYSLLGMGTMLTIFAGMITTFLLWGIWIVLASYPVMRYFDIRCGNATFDSAHWRNYCREAVEAREEKAKR